MKNCNRCDGVSPDGAEFCIDCGGRFPMEGPTQKLSLAESERWVGSPGASLFLGGRTCRSLSFGDWTLGASGLYWREVEMWRADPVTGNLVMSVVQEGVRPEMLGVEPDG